MRSEARCLDRPKPTNKNFGAIHLIRGRDGARFAPPVFPFSRLLNGVRMYNPGNPLPASEDEKYTFVDQMSQINERRRLVLFVSRARVTFFPHSCIFTYFTHTHTHSIPPHAHARAQHTSTKPTNSHIYPHMIN